MSAIQADYRTFKHIPSRKCYQLIMEVPEESFPNVCGILGYPATGENTFVGIALLNIKGSGMNKSLPEPLPEPQTEGEKLRTRAVMLCKDRNFQEWVATLTFARYGAEGDAVNYIYDKCNIKSRAEIAANIKAQHLFRDILDEYEAWKVSNQYADNLSR